MKTKQEITESISALKPYGAWANARKTYALELLAALDGDYSPAALLNGARTWKEYSEGGCSLIHDADICDRVSSPSEAARKKHGEIQPNPQESWMECQARCLTQAAALIATHADR